MSSPNEIDDHVEITVDGQALRARKGAMLIEVTDAAGIDIPRFCYHKKLSIAANCRMCLVDVEKAPKPLPACATPVMSGMVVSTRSERAVDAQKSTMEFLLINHPLDCPICDQGGECELQDQAMGYGEGVSKYHESKRVIFDKYIGPLIATELTRCIHCTRCIRFGEEIAGLRELGMTGRGENSRVGTFIEKSIDSELSGNVIDLCPVGALTARPSRFTARPWELTRHASVAPHDCVGSNIYIHSRRGQAIRVVPRDNEAINEVWISDRDRFSYEAIHSDMRLQSPQIKKQGKWVAVDWSEALDAAAEILRVAGDNLGTLVSPIATLEEQYLAQKITRQLGSSNIDHRLRQRDFSDQDSAPIMPWLGMDIDAIDHLDAALVVAGNPRTDQPIIGHRLRKASLGGAKVSFINAEIYPQNFRVHSNIGESSEDIVSHLAAIARILDIQHGDIPSALRLEADDAHHYILNSLKTSKNSVVWLGSAAVTYSNFAIIRSLCHAIATATGAVFGYLPEAGNTVGAWLSGCIPHRGTAGQSVAEAGKSVSEMTASEMSGYLLLGIDPDADCTGGEAMSALHKTSGVVAMSSFASDQLCHCADVLLPIGTFAETSGTFVNATGAWQSFRGAVAPVGEARPAWKVLRVLANRLALEGIDYITSEDIREEVKQQCRDIVMDNSLSNAELPEYVPSQITYVPIYSVDPLTRRAASLQKTNAAKASNRAPQHA